MCEEVIKRKSLERRSEEVQDIIDRMPTGWTSLVVLVLSILLAILTVISFLISYPDTVDGEITLTSELAPVRLVAQTSGRLHLLKQPNEDLQVGEVIAYMESGVDYNSILYLDSLLLEGIQNRLPHFDRDIELGELGTSYGAYMQAYTGWYRLKTSTRYSTIRQGLYKQIATDRALAQSIRSSLELKDKSIRNSQDLLSRDSTLRSVYLISEYEYRQNENSLLSQHSDYLSGEASYLNKQSEIQQTLIQILRSEIEEEENLEEAYNALIVRHQALVNDVRLWKERNFFISTIEGKLDYLGFWREHMMIASGTEVFSITPLGDVAIGEAIIPTLGAGKIELGMEVNIKLNDYPYEEYGLLKGNVVSVSNVSHKVSTRQGNIDAYRVRLSLPEGLKTNFNHELHIGLEAKGRAEIIAKPRRLIERLFDNLRVKANK